MTQSVGLSAEAAAIVVDTNNRTILERLQVWMTCLSPGSAERLVVSLNTAADQLECMTPAAMAMTSGGQFCAGPITNVPRGAILVVLADGHRCVTSGFNMRDVADAFDELIALAAEVGVKAHPAAITSAMVDLWGARPGKKAPRGSPGEQQMGVMLGGLLSAIPAANLAKLAASIEDIRQDDICPALIGLVAPSSSGIKGTASFIWPILLPVAEYADAFAERAT